MKCSDKEWQHCNKEKMGCEGCFYNEEISIGYYVRTPKQGICIISHINKPFKDDDKNKVCLCQNSKVAFVSINTIKQLKHSKEIIDLVEEGDYVNGKRVIKANCRFTYIDDDSSYGESEIENGLDLGDELIYWSSEIKSIITKEQIKQIEFRIGD